MWTLEALGARAENGEQPIAQSEPASPAPTSGKEQDLSAKPSRAADRP
jgi:hypothetical protein